MLLILVRLEVLTAETLCRIDSQESLATEPTEGSETCGIRRISSLFSECSVSRLINGIALGNFVPFALFTAEKLIGLLVVGESL